MILFTYIELICCMKFNTSISESIGDLLVSWVPIWYCKACTLSHLKMTYAFTLSGFPKSHGTSQMPCKIQYEKSQPSPACTTQRHTKEAW